MSNDKPKYDFVSVLGLKYGDKLDGYTLTKDGERYDLREVEAAYQAADAKGLVTGTLAARADRALVVVVGRNTELSFDVMSAAHYPVEVEYLDEYTAEAVDSLTLVQCPVKVVARPGNRAVSGMLTEVKLDSRGRSSVVIDDQAFLLRDLFALELA